MKKRLTTLLAAALLAISFAAPAVVSAVDEEFDPACADIVSGGGTTVLTEGGDYDLVFALATDGPCGGVTYTLYVYDDEADCSLLPIGEVGDPEVTLIKHGSRRGAEPGVGEVVFSASDVDNDGTVWVFATSSDAKADYDRAPDTGCTDYGVDPPGKGFG